MLELEEDKTSPTRIKVVGVGGGGMNAVNRMIDANLRGVEFYVVNTDEQVLKKSSTDNQIAIGQKTTRGMGAGGDPDIGFRAAMEDKDNIAHMLKGADMVFVTAGMGGGTGTGAAPIIAEIAREQGALTVGVVTMPFEVEGHKRMDLARRGVAALKEKVDTLITIKNESLFKVIDRSTSVNVAFRIVDDILYNAVKGISDLINTAGVVNVDFADVRAIMGETGDAIMGAGEGIGENRVAEAVSQAIGNVLLDETSIEGATALLLNVCGGEDMSITEWKEVSEIITEKADPRANIIIGLTVDASLAERIRVTVIATGFRKKTTVSQELPRARASGQSFWNNPAPEYDGPSERGSRSRPYPVNEATRSYDDARTRSHDDARTRSHDDARTRSHDDARARSHDDARTRSHDDARTRSRDDARARSHDDARTRSHDDARARYEVRPRPHDAGHGRLESANARFEEPLEPIDFEDMPGREKEPGGRKRETYPEKLDLDDLEIPAYLRRRG